MNDRQFDRALRVLAREGYVAGAAAGSWLIDGNTSLETAAEWLIAEAGGDDGIYSCLPSCPLSGEWAGDPSEADVLAMVGVEPDVEVGRDELLQAFENGWNQGVLDEVLHDAHAMFGLEPARRPRAIVSDARRVQAAARAFALEWYPVRAGRAALARVTKEVR